MSSQFFSLQHASYEGPGESDEEAVGDYQGGLSSDEEGGQRRLRSVKVEGVKVKEEEDMEISDGFDSGKKQMLWKFAGIVQKAERMFLSMFDFSAFKYSPGSIRNALKGIDRLEEKL